MPRAALMIFAGMLFAGCTETKAEVNCQGSGEAIACTLKHVQGSDTVDACFDIAISCRNGKTATAHGCETLVPSQVANKIFQDKDFSNLEGCEPSGSTVKNLVLKKK